MLTVKNILFPTDFSDCAEHAFAQAAHLAESYEAVLQVLNVVVAHPEDPDNPMAYLKEMEHPGPSDEADEECRDENGICVIHAQEVAFTEARGILDYAERHDVDLIVMGTHGRRGLGRLLMGSVAEKVVRLAPVPVLTVCQSAEAGGAQPIRRVLAPVDFSEYTAPALTHAKELAAVYDARVDLLHVITEVALPGVYGLEPVSVAEPGVQDRVRQALEEAMTRSPGAERPFSVHVLVGYPAHDIAEFAAEHDIDLVVIATHGRTGLKRLFMGSVAENVVRLACCPVFTLKSFGKSLLADDEAEVAQTANGI